jgi:hypothetical protein
MQSFKFGHSCRPASVDDLSSDRSSLKAALCTSVCRKAGKGRTGTVNPIVKSHLRLHDFCIAACNEGINQQMRIPEKTRHRRPLVGRRD